MATDTNNPSHDWADLRRALDRFTQTIARLTSDLEDIYVALDGEPMIAPVVQLQFDATASTGAQPDQTGKRRTTPKSEAAQARSNWTFEEDNLVVAGKKLGMTNREIGAALGRTASGVKNRANEMRKRGLL